MKSLVKTGLAKVAESDRMWSLLNRTFLYAARHLDHLRQRHLQEGRRAPLQEALDHAAAETLRTFPDLTVRHGLFAGMHYPRALATGSSLFPKLLGCYEHELHDYFAAVPSRGYSAIVDVGCAEGYYAVGLARLCPEAQVFAFDVSETSRQACQEMAELNGVANRVHIRGWCSPTALLELPLGPRALIISDCEGYELNLFPPDIAEKLAPHDVLIETHDFMNPDISIMLRKRFDRTHDVAVTQSVDDAEKAAQYLYPEVEGLTFEERIVLLGEFRPAIMRWLRISSRQ